MAAPAVVGWEALGQPVVVHSIPGRVRLRFPRRQVGEAPTFAQRLLAHPAVSSVSWSPPARSLTVQFLPAMTLRELLLTAPPSAECPPAKLETTRRLDWGRIAAACLLASLPISAFASVALAVATELAGQARNPR